MSSHKRSGTDVEGFCAPNESSLSMRPFAALSTNRLAEVRPPPRTASTTSCASVGAAPHVCTAMRATAAAANNAVTATVTVVRRIVGTNPFTADKQSHTHTLPTAPPHTHTHAAGTGKRERQPAQWGLGTTTYCLIPFLGDTAFLSLCLCSALWCVSVECLCVCLCVFVRSIDVFPIFCPLH